MTTATTEVVKEDLVTPADPFDFGSGRIVVDAAANPGLTFDASAQDMSSLGLDPLHAVHLNQPSINVPVLPGRLTTTRTATNVTDKVTQYQVEATAPDGSSISVSPNRLDIRPQQSAEIEITIESSAPEGQYFGEVRLVPRAHIRGMPTLHLPVAFSPGQGTVTLSSSCVPDDIARGETSECEITAQNNSFSETTVDLSTSVTHNLRIVDAEGAQITRGAAVALDVPLAGAAAGIPALSEDQAGFGYLALDGFGVTPRPVGDEEIVNYTVPGFVYAGKTYTSIGVDSNGYLVVGGGSVEDNVCCQPVLPSPSRPNNVLAPFWTDLDGAGAPGIYVGILSGGGQRWLAVEWRVNTYGTTTRQTFQTWIGLNGVEDVWFTYGPTKPTAATGDPFVIGAEGETGEGEALPAGVLPTADLRVISSAPAPGGSVSYTVTVRGEREGTGVVTTEMDSATVAGTTVVTSEIDVRRR